jgi:hypothetical protein
MENAFGCRATNNAVVKTELCWLCIPPPPRRCFVVVADGLMLVVGQSILIFAVIRTSFGWGMGRGWEGWDQGPDRVLSVHLARRLAGLCRCAPSKF